MKLLPEEWVTEFHETFGAAINQPPTYELLELRLKLIREEVKELEEEVDNFAISGKLSSNFVKELADIQYVLSGTAIALGIDLNRAVERVHESNMSKLGADGKVHYRADGKILKGENYFEPYMDDLLP